MQEQQSQRRHESQAYKEAPREQPAYFRPDYENQYASNVKVRDGGYHGSPPKSNYAIPSDALLHDLYGGPSAGVSRVYEGKQRQRRIELAEEGGGMVFGMDKKSEAAQKRAKQEEYKRQLDQMQKKDINIPGKKHSPARSRARIADPFSNEPSLSNYRDMGYPSEYAYAQALGLMNDKRASDLYDDRGLYERQPIRNSPERVRPAPVLHTEFAIGENKNSVKKRELQDAYRRELDQQMLERKDINKQLSPQRDIPKRRDYEDQYDRYPQSRIDSAYEEPYNPYSLAKPTDNAARGGYRPHLREDPYQTDYPREYDNVGYDVNPYADAARQEDYRISPPKLNKPVHDVYRESPTKYDGWRPSGNVSDDRAKRAAAMQKAALDEQIRMDKARKEEEKEREAKRLRDEDARIQADLQAMRDEAERERQQKLASARESAQKYDEMQNKQLMEALARKGKRHTLMEKESADGYNQHGEAVNLDAQVSENPYEVYEEKAELEYDSPNKTPTKARTRLINDMYSVGNKMLAHNEIGSSIDGKWRPSGNYSDDKKKTAAAQQKAALDEQLKQDKLRKEKLKEEEKRKEEKEEARILADLNAMNEEAEREKRLKQALADEQARSMIEMQDKKMKEALARKGKVESAAKREKPRSPPLAIDVQHDQPRSIYDHISSPLQQMINQKQNEAPQSHHSNQVEHNYRPIARPDAVDSLMRSYQSNPGYPPNFHPNHMQYPYYPQQQHLYMPYQYPPENGMIYGAPSPYMQPPQYYPVYVAPPVRVNDQNNQIHQMGLQKIDENDVSFVSESRLLPAHPLASDIFASMGVGNSIESNNSRASGGRNDDSFYSQQSINSYPKKAKAEPSVDGSYEGGMRSSESIMEQSLTSNSLLMYLGNRTPVDPNLIIPQKEYKIEKEIVSDEVSNSLLNIYYIRKSFSLYLVEIYDENTSKKCF